MLEGFNFFFFKRHRIENVQCIILSLKHFSFVNAIFSVVYIGIREAAKDYILSCSIPIFANCVMLSIKGDRVFSSIHLVMGRGRYN